MKKYVIGFTALTLGMALQLAIAQDQKVIAPTVAVTQDVLTDALLGEAAKGPNTGEVRKKIQHELALQDIILKEAMLSGVAQRKDVAVQLELVRRQVIINSYWGEYFQKHPIPEAQLQSTYDMMRVANGAKQYRISQIVVKDEEAAKKVLDELQQKKVFSEVAKNLSQDPLTRLAGGDLGWRWKTDMVPAIAVKIDPQKVSEVLGPVALGTESQVFIRIDETRDQEFPDLKQARSAIEQEFRRQLQQQELARLGKLIQALEPK